MSKINPVGGVADFWSEFKRPNPYRWPILGVSLLITGTMFYGFTSEKTYIPPPRPKVDYITTFAEGRSDAEIVASNVENQKRKDETAAQRAAIEEQKRELYRSLGRASGMDVETIEARADFERKREEAAARQAHEERMGRAIADKPE